MGAYDDWQKENPPRPDNDWERLNAKALDYKKAHDEYKALTNKLKGN